ncbi:hypothetical protein TRIUR3_04057 [Triticum urartu]|uniref:Uncharacterized protein n=1 Tax=Triticum urartu TaxID=4572 RepID=M8A8S7_TRIUA|nr:hypothetical protein TRIUR3_04057 [Triticum urartu]
MGKDHTWKIKEPRSVRFGRLQENEGMVGKFSHRNKCSFEIPADFLQTQCTLIPRVAILLTNYYGIQRKLPSPGFQVEIVLVDYSGSQPPKQKPADGSADKKSDADSSTSSSAKDSNAAPVESKKETGSDDKDDVFSDNEAEDGSSKGRKEVSSSGQGGANGAKASETSVAQQEPSAVASGIEKITISGDQGIARAADAISLKTEASSKSRSTKAQPPAVESSSLSEFKAIAADASVFSFGDEDDYESE